MTIGVDHSKCDDWQCFFGFVFSSCLPQRMETKESVIHKQNGTFRCDQSEHDNIWFDFRSAILIDVFLHKIFIPPWRRYQWHRTDNTRTHTQCNGGMIFHFQLARTFLQPTVDWWSTSRAQTSKHCIKIDLWADMLHLNCFVFVVVIILLLILSISSTFNFNIINSKWWAGVCAAHVHRVFVCSHTAPNTTNKHDNNWANLSERRIYKMYAPEVWVSFSYYTRIPCI